MALPEKVIERLGREPVRTPGWSSRLLMFSSTLLFICLFVYIGLVYGYTPYLKTQLKELDGQIQKFGQEISAADQTELIAFYSQMANIKKLLNNHIAASRLFEWLEKQTQTNVFFSKLGLNIQNNQLSLAGVAKSAEDIAEQLQVFQSQPEVELVSVNNISVGASGLWQFDLSVKLSRDFLKQEVSAK
jgi:Tfp pilus assembly protein PilN